MATAVHLHRFSTRYAQKIIDMAMNGVTPGDSRIMGVGLNTILRRKNSGRSR
ncbi:IS1-like element transposase [Escherichia coli]